jgi:acyl dehydratase
MRTLHFEDHRVGYRASAGPYLVREEEIVEFGRRFDPRPFLDVECTGTRPSASRPGAGVVTLENVVRNQDGAPVMRLVALMLVGGRAAAREAP